MTEIKRLKLALKMLHAVGVSLPAAADQVVVLDPVQPLHWLFPCCLNAQSHRKPDDMPIRHPLPACSTCFCLAGFSVGSLPCACPNTSQAAFAVVVFAITAASIAEANKAMAAFSASDDDVPTSLTGALSSLQNSLGSFAGGARKLLATSSYVVVGFGSFLNFTMFVSISGAQQQQWALPASSFGTPAQQRALPAAPAS